MIGFMPPLAIVARHRFDALTNRVIEAIKDDQRVLLGEYTGRHRRSEVIEVSRDTATPFGFVPVAPAA